MRIEWDDREQWSELGVVLSGRHDGIEVRANLSREAISDNADGVETLDDCKRLLAEHREFFRAFAASRLRDGVSEVEIKGPDVEAELHGKRLDWSSR